MTENNLACKFCSFFYQKIWFSCLKKPRIEKWMSRLRELNNLWFQCELSNWWLDGIALQQLAINDPKLTMSIYLVICITYQYYYYSCGGMAKAIGGFIHHDTYLALRDHQNYIHDNQWLFRRFRIILNRSFDSMFSLLVICYECGYWWRGELIFLTRHH